MKVAINTRFLLPEKMEGFGWYTYEIVRRMVEAHPEVEFIFFFDRPYDPKFIFSSNVKPVVLRPKARHPLLFIYWFEVAIKRALITYQADVFFSPDGYLSLKSEIPQVGVIHDINFEHNPQDLPPIVRWYYRYFFPKFAKKATHLITVSEFSKQDICKTYAIAPEKITAIWNGVSDQYKPLSNEEKQAVRDEHTKGFPFFIFVGSLHPRKNVRRLIDAFLLFKENDENDKHQLLIVGAEMWSRSLGYDNLPGYLRHHIHFKGHQSQDDLVRLLGAATALTYVPYFEGFGIPLVEAMRAGTPVLSGNQTSLPEVGGDAVLYCNPFDVSDISEKMKELAHSELLQETLRRKGLERSKLFSWDTASEKAWSIIKDVRVIENI